MVDGILEESPGNCYCQNRGEQGNEERPEVSETLYGRRNIFREMAPRCFAERKNEGRRGVGLRAHRWSDCGCENCMSWQGKGEERLHLVVKEPARDCGRSSGCTAENVIFLHGFLSSSSIWVETVFPNLSESAKPNLRLIAVDLLGFGKSPKPTTCLYTLEEHLEQIERSVIKPFQLKSFHVVAHSMGCIIAIALAARYPQSVKSIALIAPPYFPSTELKASYTALNKLAERKVWPPLLFGSSVMSWYEHLGRTVCFLVCRNHLIWEWILKIVTRKRDLHFMIMDITRHTHHSAWHTMHNVVCGGAKLLNKYLEVLKREEIPVELIQGADDQVVPLECSYNIKLKVPLAEINIANNADHSTVILGREEALTKELEGFWFSSRKYELPKNMSF